MNRSRLEGCHNSRIVKLSLADSSATCPAMVSLNSCWVLSPSSPRIQVSDFQASSVRFWLRSQRTDSGRVNMARNKRPLGMISRPMGICHSREVLEMVVLWATPYTRISLYNRSQSMENLHSQSNKQKTHPKCTSTDRRNHTDLEFL